MLPITLTLYDEFHNVYQFGGIIKTVNDWYTVISDLQRFDREGFGYLVSFGYHDMNITLRHQINTEYGQAELLLLPDDSETSPIILDTIDDAYGVLMNEIPEFLQ